MDERDVASLRAELRGLGTPLRHLDRPGAAATLTNERDQLVAHGRTETAATWAADLERQAGVAGRRERNDLLAEAGVQRGVAEKAQARLEHLRSAAQALQDSGRHLDNWMAGNAERAAQVVALQRELAVRHELEVAETVERAMVDPPEHVREALGAPPERSAPERAEWEALTRVLTRAARARGRSGGRPRAAAAQALRAARPAGARGAFPRAAAAGTARARARARAGRRRAGMEP